MKTIFLLFVLLGADVALAGRRDVSEDVTFKTNAFLDLTSRSFTCRPSSDKESLLWVNLKNMEKTDELHYQYLQAASSESFPTNECYRLRTRLEKKYSRPVNIQLQINVHLVRGTWWETICIHRGCSVQEIPHQFVDENILLKIGGIEFFATAKTNIDGYSFTKN